MELGSLPLKDGQSILPVRIEFLYKLVFSYTFAKLGFGTGTAWYKDDPKDPVNPEMIEVLKTAISKGFVHLNCANSYGTEWGVGTAIKESGLSRGSFFITTKVQDGWADIPRAMEKILANLQLEHVDL